MRGFLQPSVHAVITDSQTAFRALGRGRRAKIARAAQTTLVKADQWGRGDAVPADLSDAIERALKAATTPKKK
ncbi:hypothetical protein LZC95_11080 [Pendulispora brunnea]|uniref:Uncharacterized protein n=1 Tax=Pendulispora brunnea TaxID=2905690 RepID=A0ABZ2KFA4_9BACT